MKNNDLVLEGAVDVSTNEGRWKTTFRRTFRVEQIDTNPPGKTVRLSPVFEKNRYGMLGWPNAYLFLSVQPEPEFPSHAIPEDTARLLTFIDELMAEEANASGH